MFSNLARRLEAWIFVWRLHVARWILPASHTVARAIPLEAAILLAQSTEYYCSLYGRPRRIRKVIMRGMRDVAAQLQQVA